MPMTNTTDGRVLKLAQYIEDNSQQVLNLDHLAQEAAISPFHLQRKFKRSFGVSPKQFQNTIRIQRLKQSLKKDYDVSAAIYAAGFGSASRVYEQI